MGLIVWLIAVNQENPLLTQPFPERITVVARNLPADLRPTRDLSGESVELTLQAPRSVWQQLRADQIQAYVELSGLGEGVHSVPVQVSIDNPEVIVRARSPQEIPIQLDHVMTATVPVTVTIEDNTAYGYDWQTPTVRPITVTVRGPATLVAQAAMANASVFLRGAKSSVTRIQTVEIVDTQSRPVGQLEVLPPIVEVAVPVESWPDRKAVAVRVDLEGQPADGYRLGPLKVVPNMVVLRGNADLLNTLGFVETEPVSVEGATSDLRARPRLLLPEGMTAIEGDFVDVVAGIVPVEGSSRITLRPILRGLGAGLAANAALDTMDIIVSGPQSILDALEPDDVFVILNLNDLPPGAYVITPDVAYPDGIRLEGVLPETVEVVITNSATPQAPTPASATSASTSPLTTTQPVRPEAAPVAGEGREE
jgi:YbbR domain-containing protein